ncbi:hypothetical protein J1614_003891 [Plenodomus biglobosus]|nr:hypothetical protein J1614_003891 [Plenodomus biglobosus]
MASGAEVKTLVTALRTQSKADSQARTLPCPFPDHYDHVNANHGSEIQGLELHLARFRVNDAALKLR